MRRVRWPDNICNVDMTCIHGYFTGDDLIKLWELCPSGWATPTYCWEGIHGCGYGKDELLKRLKTLGLYDREWGYYFNFIESDGSKLLDWLKETYVMFRGEGC